MTTVSDDTLLEEITRTVEEFARARGYALSRTKDRILRELVHMRQQFGQFYCPCQVGNSDDTICVCAAVRQGYVDRTGRCHCNLFQRATG